MGLLKKEVSKEFLDVYEKEQLVFAKGMGYAETLTEYKITKPHLLLFRTKCVLWRTILLLHETKTSPNS